MNNSNMSRGPAAPSTRLKGHITEKTAKCFMFFNDYCCVVETKN